jgi:hypothetical protein
MPSAGRQRNKKVLRAPPLADYEGAREANNTFWHVIVAERHSTPDKLPRCIGSGEADVAVVGAGIVGLTTAYLLARLVSLVPKSRLGDLFLPRGNLAEEEWLSATSRDTS